MAEKPNGADLERLKTLRSALLRNVSDDDIKSLLAVGDSELEKLKEELLEHDALKVRSRSAEQTYVRYVLEQRQCINALERLASSERCSSAASVAAIRAKSDIIKGILQTGMEMGMIERTGDKLAPGRAVKELTTPALQAYIIQEINLFGDYVAKFGDQKFGEIETGPIHYDLSTEKEVPQERVKHQSKPMVFRGRRVVKTDSDMIIDEKPPERS